MKKILGWSWRNFRLISRWYGRRRGFLRRLLGFPVFLGLLATNAVLFGVVSVLIGPVGWLLLAIERILVGARRALAPRYRRGGILAKALFGVLLLSVVSALFVTRVVDFALGVADAANAIDRIRS